MSNLSINSTQQMKGEKDRLEASGRGGRGLSKWGQVKRLNVRGTRRNPDESH